MATIQTAIQLQDNFTEVFYRVIEAVNLGFVAMEELQQSISSPVDMTSMEVARNSIHRAAAAVQELNESLQHTNQLEVSSPVISSVSEKSYGGEESFTNTGVEQFQQELTSVHTILHQISMQQDQITRRANEMELLSPQASYEIQSVENQVHQLRSQIEQVEANSLTIGTEESNQALERLQLQMNRIHEEQKQLQLTMQGTDVSAINQAYLQLSQTLDEVERSVQESFSQPVDLPISPVEVPITWKTENLEVFTGTGVERFQQEVQSINGMLQQLSSIQNTIARQAYNTNILPPEAFQDLNRMAVRIDQIKNQIQQIENNSFNIGTTTANSELEQLRGQLNQAISAQQSLNGAIEQMDISAANSSYLRLSQIINGTEQYIRDNVNEQGRFNQEIRESINHADSLGSVIRSAIAAYATVQTMGRIINLSDTMTQTSARLDLIVDDGGSVEELQNKIFISAQNARGSYMTTADAVSKLGMQASQAFNSNDELIAFTELLNKSFVNAGTSAQGVDSVMLQLTQAMASGKLQGEELNAVLDNAAPIVQNIQKYLEEVQNIDASNIKELASEGVITADVVKNAIFYAAADINEKFESMPMTWGQIWQSMQNTALIAFQPVLKRLNDIANSQACQTFVNGANQAMGILADIVLDIFDLIATIGSFIVDNWSIISPIIYGVAAALAVYYGWQMLCAGAAAVRAAKEAVLSAIVSANPTMKVVLAMIALITVIFVVCNAIAKMTGIANSGFGVMTGGLNVVLQFFKNLFFTVKNIAFGIGNAIAALASNIMTAFYNAIRSVQSWFYDLLSDALTVVGKICEALNRLPFVNFDYSGISSKAEQYAAKAIEFSQDKKDYKNIEDAFQKGFNTYDVFQDGWVSDAFQKGADWGDGVAEEISKIFNFSKDLDDTIFPEDYTNLLNDTNSLLSGIGDTTKGISDSLDITEEDLKYMRDLAERETINHVTMTDIKIEMGGVTNHVNSEIDLDGMVNHLTEALETQIAISAEGIH